MTVPLLKVLVVDDDPSNVELLRMRLQTLECETLVARTPTEGLQVASEAQPDLILLDLRLGYDALGGLDLLQQLRDADGTSKIPVFIHSIFVANRGDLPDAEALSDGFLLKPFKFEDLKRIIAGFRRAPVTQAS
ncbi:MAG: integral rane sensor hybrid histidine kinase [Cyanobacteria bacterium RYN_339]|nr:integral rane sensor hybrid histidine kinase [Cyanobacteria bacterium RYN_339]